MVKSVGAGILHPWVLVLSLNKLFNLNFFISKRRMLIPIHNVSEKTKYAKAYENTQHGA